MKRITGTLIHDSIVEHLRAAGRAESEIEELERRIRDLRIREHTKKTAGGLLKELYTSYHNLTADTVNTAPGTFLLDEGGGRVIAEDMFASGVPSECPLRRVKLDDIQQGRCGLCGEGTVMIGKREFTSAKRPRNLLDRTFSLCVSCGSFHQLTASRGTEGTHLRRVS